ncbi:MAG: hypothetical protein Q4D26_12200 [Clostridia bacterium]|nr:hypothetical protein [Clostridia bacterium]
MSYYNICKNCGANLDPGERCDCNRNINTIGDEVRERGLLRPVKVSTVNY